MSTTATIPLPVEVGHLGNFEARLVRNLRASVEDWDEVCSALGAWEAAHFTQEATETSREQHHAWVSELLYWGQIFERVTTHPHFPDQALAKRVKARLQHLQDKLALWHGSMTTAEEERILRAAFA